MTLQPPREREGEREREREGQSVEMKKAGREGGREISRGNESKKDGVKGEIGGGRER